MRGMAMLDNRLGWNASPTLCFGERNGVLRRCHERLEVRYADRDDSRRKEQEASKLSFFINS